FASAPGSARMNAKLGSEGALALQLLLVGGLSVALAACSRDLSVQSALAAPPPAATASAPAAPRPAAAAAAPAAQSEAPSESVVRALPDFSSLVDRYGPAVVNVEGT